MRAALVLAILAVPALAEESLEKLVEDLGSKAYGVTLTRNSGTTRMNVAGGAGGVQSMI